MKSQRILERRKQLGLTQLDVAKSSGVSKQAVSKWEKGDTFPKGESLFLLSKALKCNVSWLLNGRGSPEPEKQEHQENTLGSRILQLRNENQLTQADIAKAVGVSRSSVTLWEQDTNKPKGESLMALVSFLKCDVNWLLTGQGSPEPAKQEQETTVVSVALKPQGSYPVISWVQAGGWNDIHLTDLHDADYYPCPVRCSKNTFLLKVVGKSMNPVFREGELIFVDPDVEAVNGKYVVARLDDENQATFKQLIIEDGKKFLQAANPDWPTPIIPINGNCTIVGVVISSMKLF